MPFRTPYCDGHISFEAKLSGILSTSLAPPGGEPVPSFGILVSPGVQATAHQHFFCVRIDPAVDDSDGGKGLAVAEVNAVPVPPGDGNPYGNAFEVGPLLRGHSRGNGSHHGWGNPTR
eukprot:136668-Chlamydomonas_euryale.AAC.4